MTVLTFPIGCTQILFHKRTPLYIPELNAAQDALTLSGQVDFPSHLRSEGDTEMIVVVFRPHAMGAFLHVPISLFYNREISGFDLENGSLNELAGRIFDCGDDSLCIDLIERWLLSRISLSDRSRSGASEQNLSRAELAINTILADPRVSVTELASIACLGKKQFERIFGSCVGINPKEYARIVRFHKALSLMRRKPDTLDLTRIAYASGYADQSHFIREFKRFSGHTPSSLRKVLHCGSDLFAGPA